MKSLFRGAFFRGVSASALAISLAACTANPQPLDRPGDVPQAFTAPMNKSAPVWPTADWWTKFGAPELGPLQATAQKENLDVAQAAARVLQAEASDGIALAALFPTLGASISGERSGGNTPTFNSSTGSASRARNSFAAGLSASYQQGFFGTEYLQLQATREDLRAQRYAAAVTGIATSASVADEYFTILSFRERIAIANANISAAKRILTITQAKVNSGVSSNLDLAEEQALVAQQESQLPVLIQAEKQARYSLAVLLGRAPEGYDVTAQNLDGIDAPSVQPGLPSELLLRNPAIAQAEAQLYSAHANVDAARTFYFPSLNLSGGASYGSSSLSNLFGPAGFIWNIGASVAQTIFDGGRIHAQNDQAKALQLELIANYRKTVFTGFQDVETSLDEAKAFTDQLALIEVQTRASAEAFRISELQYREGTIDIVQLLQNQENLFGAQQALVQTKLSRLEAYISLYSALGGGWEQKADDASYKNQLDWWPL
jgi:NodT family efflux transporter outer membrane factor (OMF) lipoprotein